MHKEYGIIGYPLSHSFSPAYFTRKFTEEHIDAAYKAYPLATIDELPALFDAQQLAGLNVTLPYKQQVLPFLDALDEEARQIGAVNCIAIHNGKTKGYNTDVAGFERSLLPLLNHNTKALILGTGGASLAVNYVLDKLNIAYQSVSRTPVNDQLSYTQLNNDIIEAHTLIINTTPLGMYPDVHVHPPLPYGAMGTRHVLYDLIYNPEETEFLALGKEHGATVKNGYEMLVLQAEASWEIWNS